MFKIETYKGMMTNNKDIEDFPLGLRLEQVSLLEPEDLDCVYEPATVPNISQLFESLLRIEAEELLPKRDPNVVGDAIIEDCFLLHPPWNPILSSCKYPVQP